MATARFFISGSHATGSRVTIEGADAHKIARVLRLREGGVIEIVDSTGACFVATIVRGGAPIELVLGESIDDATRSSGTAYVDLAQAIPKGQKMDFVVEKATELGAAAILPFYSERTLVRDLGEPKLERWRRLATAAAQQSGRIDIPTVAAPLSFAELVETMGAYDLVLFAWELAPNVPLRDRLPPLLAAGRRLLLVIGPEGGFTHEEAETARERGAELIWLGRRILRTETAALACLAVIGALSG